MKRYALLGRVHNEFERDSWLDQEVLKRHCHFWRAEFDKRQTNSHDSYFKAARAKLSSARLERKKRQTKDYKVLRAEEIMTRVTGLIASRRLRSFVSVKVGSGSKGGSKGNRSITVKVGYMWMQRVAPIYERGYDLIKKSDWFILDAQRVKVNIKNVALYECFCFNMKDGHSERTYLAETTVGNTEFVMAPTAKLAAERAVQLITQGIVKRMETTDDSD